MGNHAGRPEDPEAGRCGGRGSRHSLPAGRPSPTALGRGRAARGRRGARTAKFPGVSPASGMRAGGGELTCARAATGKRRRLTWRPGPRGGRGGGGRGAGVAPVAAWAVRADFVGTVRVRVTHFPESCGRWRPISRSVNSSSDPGLDCDCFLLKIASAYSGIPALLQLIKFLFAQRLGELGGRQLASGFHLLLVILTSCAELDAADRGVAFTNKTEHFCTATHANGISFSPQKCILAGWGEMVQLGLESWAGR